MHQTYSACGTSSFGSFERFNRVLYGGHAHDDRQERFFTFAGDTPIFMGASSDYTKNTWCYQAKNGVLLSGLAMTPGHAEMGSHDLFSSWFHESSDIIARYHHGYMSYELTRFSPYFPDVLVRMEVYPLSPDDGYVVHYDITTDQRVVFCAGFGGVTPFFGRFEYHTAARRDFSSADCEGNRCELGANYGRISGANDVSMWIAADFDCSWSQDASTAMEEQYPSRFLTPHSGERQIVKITRILQSGEHFTGNILVLRNGSPEMLKKYLQNPNLRRFLRGQIREKFAACAFHTPDETLNGTFSDTIIALDAAFHGRSFYHGAIGYHAPFLGWRAWYAPVLLGWAERVTSAINNHFDTITRSDKPEKVWWDGGDRPDLDHEGTQYHHLENTRGRLTALLYRDDIYDMQEVAVDMTLYYLEHTADFATCEKIYDRLCETLDWQERILDPDGSGLYQNFLNTWISDGHSYNGAECAQASSYNYSANMRTARLGRKLGRDATRLEARAKHIQKAYQSRIWQEQKGIPAESIDTIGNRLLHDAPELSTIYLAADCGNVDTFQMWRMLRWTERNIKHTDTVGRGGKLYFSSNWLPKKYSTCGIFPAENACLALTYFQNGQREKAMEILNGLADAFMLSPYPGSITHVLSAHGGTDDGDIDFTDVSSCYLRLLIEGLWGIRFTRSEGYVRLSPQLPDAWTHASISLPDVSMTMNRGAMHDDLVVEIADTAKKIIRLPMRHAAVDQLFIDGEPSEFQLIPGIGCSFAEVVTEKTGTIHLSLYYEERAYPTLRTKHFSTFSGNTERIIVEGGELEKIIDFRQIMQEKASSDNSRTVALCAAPGEYDALVQVRCGETSLLLPLTVELIDETPQPQKLTWRKIRTLNLSDSFNLSLTSAHEREFRSPRPKKYSIGMRLNGRYAWEWNHWGHNALRVDDTLLRNSGGVIHSKSGIAFLTPAQGNNCVTVSLWDNDPSRLEIPLSGRAKGLAVLLCGTTHAMQSCVVNGKLSVIYEDDSTETIDLIPPENFDDFLVTAFQAQNETLYFGEGTHGMIQQIRLNPEKNLKAFAVEAVANEVLIHILALTLLED